MAQILIVGCGYAGERVARLHRDRGDMVTGTTRDPARRARLQAAGVNVLDHKPLAAGPTDWPTAERIYYTVPPPGTGIVDTCLRDVLARLSPPSEFIYFSTTGVYGDHDGSRVTEDTPLSPATDRARRRVDAERQVQDWCTANHCRYVLLRIAGIYGPDRLPLDKLRRGEPVAAHTGPGNRIQVDDLARAAVVVADAGGDGAWNVSDGNTMPTADFTDLVADIANLPRPRRVPPDSAEISAGMRSFLVESRQVDNSKLLRTKGFRLLFPDPAAGIRASITK